MTERQVRQAIVDGCKRMNALGINQGTSGNISVRLGKGMLISPSAVPYDRLTTDDIVFVSATGDYESPRRPSSEWRFHRDILAQRDDVNAIIHAHPLYCTTLAICGKEIPPLHYMVAAAGGSHIRCAEYATFGTEALSKNVLAALGELKACLIANHGAIAVGPDLEAALWLAVEIETLAHQYVLSLQLGGPNLLAEEEIERVLCKFKDYGYKPATSAR